MKLGKHIRKNKTALLRLGRSYLRRASHLAFRSIFSRTIMRYLAMDAKKALRIVFYGALFQISIRPRLRLSFRAIAVLTLVFVSTLHLSQMVSSKKQDLKINGQAVMVAKDLESNAEIVQEISSTVSVKISPFTYNNPVESGLISQGFSTYHLAVDIATPLGSSIKPLGSGVVEFTGLVSDGKGNIVVVDHGDGLKTIYAHMGDIKVGVGNGVDSNTILGTVGMTGRTTGPHVHLEVYDRGVAMNPASVLP